MLILLSSCSFKSFVIPNLDYLIVSRINKNVGFNSKQKYKAEGEIKLLLKSEISRIKLIKDYLKLLRFEGITPMKEFKLFNHRFIST